jgi:SAM-dependent methyltransferase
MFDDSSRLTRRTLLCGLAGAVAIPAFASAARAQTSVFPPPVKLDVPYVPTPQDIVDRMLEIAKVTRDDYVMDLGCGDGRMLVTAASRYGARGFGVDINPVRISEANENAKKAGVTDKVRFEIKDLFKTPIEQASVLTLYLLPSVMLTLRSRILADMKAGSRIVSHDFHFDDWEPDLQETNSDHDIFHWIVPARAEGLWTLNAGGEKYSLMLRQKFQKVEGRMSAGKTVGLIREGRLAGEKIRFNAVFDDGRVLVFNGKVTADGLVADTAHPPLVVKEWTGVRAN